MGPRKYKARIDALGTRQRFGNPGASSFLVRPRLGSFPFYNILGKSGHRAPHWSFMLWAAASGSLSVLYERQGKYPDRNVIVVTRAMWCSSLRQSCTSITLRKQDVPPGLRAAQRAALLLSDLLLRTDVSILATKMILPSWPRQHALFGLLTTTPCTQTSIPRPWSLGAAFSAWYRLAPRSADK